MFIWGGGGGRGHARFADLQIQGKEKQHLAEGLEYDERNLPVDDMWPILCELDQANFPLVTGVYYQEDEWNKKANNKQGLKTHHAYSLLGAKEVDGVKLASWIVRVLFV